jgi:3-deoxy-D-manno-octulosonate 8-phosphate phosphatase KdsC-like HAD superfamily phosphatase
VINFAALMDLAIDFCEDIEPLSVHLTVQEIVSIFVRHGAQAKISSIHVNGWFGDYNKLTMSLRFLQEQFGLSAEQSKIHCAFSGDSPNDEPMFAFFPKSFAVANIQNFISTLGCKPKFVSPSCGGLGFAEISRVLISARRLFSLDHSFFLLNAFHSMFHTFISDGLRHLILLIFLLITI